MSEAIKWYETLSSVFPHIVPVGVALNITKPYVEDGYTLPTFAECMFSYWWKLALY